jgi:hypothetical protein
MALDAEKIVNNVLKVAALPAVPFQKQSLLLVISSSVKLF